MGWSWKYFKGTARPKHSPKLQRAREGGEGERERGRWRRKEGWGWASGSTMAKWITRRRQGPRGAITSSTRSHGTLSPTLTNAANGSPSRPTPNANAAPKKSPERFFLSLFLSLPPSLPLRFWSIFTHSSFFCSLSLSLSLSFLFAQYAQEQDFFRQTSLISKKEKEKVYLFFMFSSVLIRRVSSYFYVFFGNYYKAKGKASRFQFFNIF